jgi:hypothetical protein
MPHTPSAHHAVPRSRSIPDGLTPRAPSHLGIPRINKPKIKYPAMRMPITTACASTLCSRHHFVRLFLANCATLNASVIFAQLYCTERPELRLALLDEIRRCHKLAQSVRPLAGVLSIIEICTKPLARVRAFLLFGERSGSGSGANQLPGGSCTRWSPAPFTAHFFANYDCAVARIYFIEF